MRTLEISIPFKHHYFFGELTIPEKPLGLIIFSIDKDSTRWDVQYKVVADYLNQQQLATLLIDHTTVEEMTAGHKINNLKQLSDRLVNTTLWIENHSAVAELPLGYYAGGIGAAVAFKAAAILGARVKGIVTKSGNPGSVMPVLSQVIAPALLLVGEFDSDGLVINKLAMNEICGERSLKIIPGTGSMFNRRSKLGEVAERTSNWFHIYMGKPTFIQVE